MPVCFIKGHLVINDKCRPFWYQANEVQATCDKCLRDHDAELAFDCYSKECPSTNKTLKIDGWGPDKTRKPTWDPDKQE